MISKNCLHCQSPFDIVQSDLDFYDKISPTFAGKIPSPTLCPDCRQRKRLAFRNERNLYRRTCDASGKQIISIYSPDKPYKVYDQKIWWSDSRDPMDYGFDFDFTKNFTENFRELITKVPRMALMIQDSINSDYSNLAIGNKDCYLTFGGDFSELCYYMTYGFHSHNCMDGYWIFDCNNCYECSDLYNSTGCLRCTKGKNLFDCLLCLDCEGCSSCIGCVGLRNKQYHVFNKEHSKEDFLVIKKELQSYKKIQQYKQDVEKMIRDMNHVIIDIVGSENCTGKKITNSKNCLDCYQVEDGEDCKYNFINAGIQNSQDTSQAGHGVQWNYNSLGIASSSNVICSNYIWGNNSKIFYCLECMQNSTNLFGCIGLRNKSYCIFNKQYTKEEYELTVSKIISHMITTGERGEFFHPSLSPFGYNETVAQEYYPTQQGKLEQFGYKRSDYESPTPLTDKVIEGKDLPDTIEEVHDDILKSAIKCEVTGKLFRIIPQELTFYRKHSIPLPRRHPDQRHLERLTLSK